MLKIALLQADIVDEDLKKIFGNIPDIFINFFTDYQNVSIDVFNVQLEQYPICDDYEAYIITGSRYMVHDNHLWIAKLYDFVKELAMKKRKIIGFCFGHQMIAKVMGGTLEISENWNIGAQEMIITNIKPWMDPLYLKLQMLFNHRCCVVKLPENADIHARTDLLIQMYSFENHLLGIQSHPEYTASYQESLMERVIGKNNRALINEAKLRNKRNNLKMDISTKAICQWIYNFIIMRGSC